MAKDDRFTFIAGTLAVLITAGLFLWSHWGSWALTTGPNTVAEYIEVSDNFNELMSREECSDDREAPQIVPALYEIETDGHQPAVKAPNEEYSSVDATVAILEDLANQWVGAQVPAAAEVVVRQDRDGRMIVANGTHRQYKSLRQAIESLDPVAVEAALQQIDGDKSAAGEVSLSAVLTEALDTTLAIEVPDVEPDMVAGVHAWQFADAEFQHLSQGQKHLLLMGRANATAVRAKLVEIRQLLGGPEILSDLDRPSLRTEPVVIAEFSAPTAPLEILIEP